MEGATREVVRPNSGGMYGKEISVATPVMKPSDIRNHHSEVEHLDPVPVLYRFKT